MPKHTSKNRRIRKQQATPSTVGGSKPPSLLMGSPAVGTVATSSAEISGLPSSSSRKEENDRGLGFLRGDGSPGASLPSQAPPPAGATTNPHDAASALTSALANHSPKPPSRPTTPRHGPARSPSVTRQPYAERHPRTSSFSSDSRQGSTHSVNAPLVIRGGKGISFAPPAAHVTAPVDSAEVEGSSAIPVVERIQLERSASTAAREIVGLKAEKEKGKEKSTSGKLKKAAPATHASPSRKSKEDKLQAMPLNTEPEDPVAAQEVDAMLRKGKIPIGKNPELVAPPAPLQAGQITPDQVAEPNEEGSAAVVPKKRDFEEEAVEHGEEPSKKPQPSANSSPSRNKKRSILSSPTSSLRKVSQPSDEEPVLNEISHEDIAALSDRESIRSASPPAEVHPLDEDDGQAKDEEVSSSAYTLPYTPRNDSRPARLSGLSKSDDHSLAISLFASLARHSTTTSTPFEDHRRLEVHLAWKEPQTWKWVPLRRFIPDWKLEYVGTIEEKKMGVGLVRSVIRGVLGTMPIAWRFAKWV